MEEAENLTEATEVFAKRPREFSEEKEGAAADADLSTNAAEQPRKRARREDQQKCSKCKARLARRACSQSACISCCSDDNCEGHKEARETAKWKEQVLKGTTQVQQGAKAKRASAVLPGTFHEPGLRYMKQSIEIWNRRKFLANPKWRGDAIRRVDKRRALKMMRATTKPIRNSIKRFRRVMDDLYLKSLKKQDMVASAVEEVKKSIEAVGTGGDEEPKLASEVVVGPDGQAKTPTGTSPVCKLS